MTHGPVRSAYDRLTGNGVISPDPAQLIVTAALDGIVAELNGVSDTRSPLGRLFRRRGKPSAKGLYVHGGVGRGKTMLMDLFHGAAPVRRKRRIHFHGFMSDVHNRIHRVREEERTGARPAGDPIAPVAAEIAAEIRLLSLDEFAVTDIADAMILSRLFSALFDAGLVLVATSNNAPEDLYRHGLNRQLFLPFVGVLKEHANVLALDGDTDYRLAMLAGRPIYLMPNDADADVAMDRLWRDLARGEDGASTEIAVKGRAVAIPRAACGVARFDFTDLAEAALGPDDFLAIARAYDTVFVDNIPVIEPQKRDVARRLVLLVDALYDGNVKLVASAAAPPDRLYRGQGEVGDAFRRTASRLVEMQSEAYLAGSNPGRQDGGPAAVATAETELARPSQSG